MTDPIRAHLDKMSVCSHLLPPPGAEAMAPTIDALRAVLDLLGAHIPGDVKWINDHEIHRVIAEHLGVTDE